MADALRMCFVLRQEEELYERAAVRWVARFCSECEAVEIGDVKAAAGAFESIASGFHEQRAFGELEALGAKYGLFRP